MLRVYLRTILDKGLQFTVIQKADAVAQTIPGFGANEGGVLTLGRPEEPHRRIAFDAEQLCAVLAYEGGCLDLMFVEDQCFVVKGLLATGDTTLGIEGHGEALGRSTSLIHRTQQGLGLALQGDVATLGLVAIVVGQVECGVSSHLEIHRAFAQIFYGKSRSQLSAVKTEGHLDATGEGIVGQFLGCGCEGEHGMSFALFENGPNLLAHKAVLSHRPHAAVISVLSVPMSAHRGEEDGRCAVPKFGIALPQIFVTRTHVLQALHFCALECDLQYQFVVL